MKSTETPLFFPSSGICLGIDPVVADFDGASHSARLEFEAKLERHCRVIEQLDHRHALKPNLGFFLRLGSWGISLLEGFCHRFSGTHAILLDGKFGEISTTLEAYLDFAFGVLHAQSITINPFLGEQSIRQSLIACNESTAGFGRIYVLCSTSQHGSYETNPQARYRGLGSLQAAEEIIQAVRNLHIEFGNPQEHSPIGLVVGAGRVDIFQRPDLQESKLPLLCPGLGAQGASFEGAARLSERLGFPNPCLFPLSRYIFDGGNFSTEQSLERIHDVRKRLTHSIGTFEILENQTP